MFHVLRHTFVVSPCAPERVTPTPPPREKKRKKEEEEESLKRRAMDVCLALARRDIAWTKKNKKKIKKQMDGGRISIKENREGEKSSIVHININY